MKTLKNVLVGRITKNVGNAPTNHDLIYQFCIEGDSGCDDVVNPNDNSVSPGTTDQAGTTIHTADHSFIDRIVGRVAGSNLLTMRNLRIVGQMASAMKLGQIAQRPG